MYQKKKNVQTIIMETVLADEPKVQADKPRHLGPIITEMVSLLQCTFIKLELINFDGEILEPRLALHLILD